MDTTLWIDSIPTLCIGEPRKKAVLVYHGLGVSKHTQRKELESLASRGFLGVGVDAVGHGDRRLDNFDEYFSSNNPHQAFLSLVLATVREIPFLLDRLTEQFGIQSFGIVGISMGGYVTFAAVPFEKRLKAAVSILGSPDWRHPSIPPRDQQARHLLSHSPHQYPHAFAPTALLSLNAGRDRNVPPAAARAFTNELWPYYDANAERLAYVEYPESDHFMRETDWNDLWNRTLGWFERFL